MFVNLSYHIRCDLKNILHGIIFKMTGLQTQDVYKSLSIITGPYTHPSETISTNCEKAHSNYSQETIHILRKHDWVGGLSTITK